LATIPSLGELRVSPALEGVIAAAIPEAETCCVLQKSTRAAVFRAHISQHSTRGHVHTRVKEKAMRLSGKCVSELKLVLRHISHVTWNHVGLGGESRAIVGKAGTLHGVAGLSVSQERKHRQWNQYVGTEIKVESGI